MSFSPSMVARALATLSLAAGLLLAVRAEAGDAAAPAPSAVEKLSAEELEVVRRRVPEWDRLDPAAQGRIAANVVRLRTLEPAQRDRVLARARRLDRAGPVAVQSFLKNVREYRGLSPDQQSGLVRAVAVVRAVGFAVLADLPAEARAVLADDGGGEPTASQRIHLATCAGSAWRRRVIASLVATPALDADTVAAPGTPPVRVQALRDARERVREAGGAAAPEALRVRLAQLVFEDRLHAVKARFPKPAGGGPVDAAHGTALGRALRDVSPSAYDEVVAEVAAAAARGREGLAKFCEQHAPERAPPRQRTLWSLLDEIERRRPSLPPEVLGRADDFEAALLTALRVPDARIQHLQGLRAPAERRRALLDLLREFGPLGGTPVRDR